MTETAVQYELQDRVAVVTLDDGKANAISHQVAADLHDALGRARDEAAAVVLAGRPGALLGRVPPGHHDLERRGRRAACSRPAPSSPSRSSSTRSRW